MSAAGNNSSTPDDGTTALATSSADGQPDWSSATNQLLNNQRAGDNGSDGGAPVGTVTHFLSLRLDRPLEGCDLKPRVYLYSKQRTATGTANKPYNQADHVFQHRWLRGPEAQVCPNPTCPRAKSFTPLEWSMWALHGVRVQCVICHKLQVPRHRTIFCNAKCFQEAWKEHQKTHALLKKQLKKNTGVVQPLNLIQSPKKAAAAVTGLEGLDGMGDLEDESPEEEDAKAEEAAELSDIVEQLMSDEVWQEVHKDAIYYPGPEDVGHCLRLETRAVLPDGSLVCPPKTITTEPVLSTPPLPPKRQLVTVKGSGAGGGLRFRVVSYNLLAEIYATQSMYPYCDFWALTWAYRKNNLLREILEAGADVLCLQEVQADAYQHHFQPLLAEKGYDGLYKPKTRESMGMVGKVDGCAIFWKRQKFRLAENYAIEFNECARRAATAMGLPPEDGHQFLHRLCKDNVAQVAVLEVLQRPRGRPMPAPASQLCVANTHLYSNPEFPDVKLWQSHALVQELEHFVIGRGLPLLVCGDFNSEPTSAVYELLASQGLSQDHPDLGSDPFHVLPDPNDLAHSIQLQSAMSAVLGEEPAYTNYTRGFKGVLDYIWFSLPHLRPLAVAPVPTPDEIMKFGEALPNVQLSSDHIMLCCDMQLGGLSGAPPQSHSPLFQGQKPRQPPPPLGSHLGGHMGGRFEASPPKTRRR